jgi:hypothetical protein
LHLCQFIAVFHMSMLPLPGVFPVDQESGGWPYSRRAI